MPSYDWKALNDYVIIETYSTGLGKYSKLLELCCLKVIDNKIVDEFYSKVNPKIHKLAEREKYKEYEQYPTMKELAPKFLEFIKGFYLVGWNVYADRYYLQKDGDFEFKKMSVDLYECYHRTYKDVISPYYVKSAYDVMYSRSNKYVNYDFETLKGCCMAIKQLYESRKSYNKFVLKELPSYDYIELPDGRKYWLKGDKSENKV